VTSPTPTAEAASGPVGQAGDGPPFDHRRDARADLRAGLRWAAVILTLSLVAVVGILWTAERPVRGSAALPSPSAGGDLGATVTSRLAADPPLTDVIQDQGNPVPLPDGSTFWIFADSAHLTPPYFFVTSSAAVSAPGSTRMTFLQDRNGVPVELLARTRQERAQQDAKGYVPIWPTGATALPDGRIIISYTKWYVQRQPTTFTMLSSGLFEYRYPGSPQTAQPARRIADGIWTGDEGSVGSPVYAGGFVYLQVCQDSRCYSLRTTPDRLADRSAYRWWTGTGWSAQIRDRRAMEFGANRPGRNPALGRLPSGVWVMTDTDGGKASDHGLLWVAATPYGPWSVPVRFGLKGCVSFGCYAAIVHPQQSTDRRVRVGYVTFGASMYVHLVEVAIRLGTGDGRPTVRAG
jgi:hypothetical protein